jgi:epoxyqueuosine reductase QueG
VASFSVDSRTRKRFESNPNRFIEEVIKKFVRTSPFNRLDAFDGEPIFEIPLIGFADGDDPLFAQYKKVVHKQHFTPREILTKYLAETLKEESPFVTSVSVISFALPINHETKESNTQEKEGPSLRWNNTRWKGQDFITELSRHLVCVLEHLGVHALAPELSLYFEIFIPPDNLASSWSQRHMAYAAGLGTFSLNDGFITPKGMAMRFGSVVTDLKLEPSPRPYEHHLANCLFYATGKCGACIRRCPGDALSEKGHDKLKCLQILFEKQKPWMEGAHGPGYIGLYAGCGLCQTGVPCESRIPIAPEQERSKRIRHAEIL